MKKTNQKGAVLVGGNIMWNEIQCFDCGEEMRLQRGVVRLDENGCSIFRFICACEERSCKIDEWWVADRLNVLTKTCLVHKFIDGDSVIAHDHAVSLLHPDEFSMSEFRIIMKRVRAKWSAKK